MCGRVGLTLDGLPEIIPTVLAERPQTTLGAPLTATVDDQMGALAGIGATTSGKIKVTYGTGCFIQANVGSSRPDAPAGLLPICVWEFPMGKASYGIEGGVFTAATAVNWLVSLGVVKDVKELDQLATRIPWGETLFYPLSAA